MDYDDAAALIEAAEQCEAQAAQVREQTAERIEGAVREAARARTEAEHAEQSARTAAIGKAVTTALGTAPVVRKAKDEPQMTAVFDQHGNLIGTVDPGKITPVSNGAEPTAGKHDATAQALARVRP